MSKKILALLVALYSSQLVHAEDKQCCGKAEIAPAYLHIDVLEHEKTVRSIDMPAIRAEGTWLVYQGLSLKPTILYGSNDSDLFSAQLGLGYCIPWRQFIVTPSAGCGYTSLNTRTNIPIYQLFHLKENFKSCSPYLAVDLTWNFCKDWRVAGSVQYSWSRTHTTIKGLGKFNSRAEGPSYSALLEYDVTPEWSVNFGGAYNVSLDREKFGIRGYGFKLGIARWFYTNNCCSVN